ncbi:hydrolase [Bacillus sp. Marseille-P3661]|uniref:hydrolase n=1 Tax=Bacillus sp. Marseille-P3661 TaxID=1936234 RepID=UPI000C84A273|nr:hydrolase [Bacillus sp. Marseille-P3661]
MEKKTYYIAVGSREISQFQGGSPYELEIEATDEEVRQLRELFDEIYAADWMSFWRAHVPYVQYHHDKENELIDNDLKKVYQKLHDLGKPETKEHIESMGILDA